MHSIFSYLLAAGLGVLLAHFLSRPPELRSMRLAQLVLVPAGMVLCVYFLPDASAPSGIGDVGRLICFLGVLGFLALLLTSNIAYLCGAGLSNFLDPHDWTCAEEQIALRPIRRLIDQDQYSQALAELEELLQKHKPTYEALLTKAKLLHHFGRVDETVPTLLSLIPLSQTTAQQLTVMELLALLQELQPEPPQPPVSGIRRIQIHHELILFQTGGGASTLHHEIAPGVYEVEEISHCHGRWLKLAGEEWGNAEMCWQAVKAIDRPPTVASRIGLFRRITRMYQVITLAFKGKPRIQRQAEARDLFRQAKHFIRRDDWLQALPLLQKASVCDPDHYEIAYRWVQAVRHTAGAAAAAQAMSQVLRQSLWTKSEQDMLHQLKEPLAR